MNPYLFISLAGVFLSVFALIKPKSRLKNQLSKPARLSATYQRQNKFSKVGALLEVPDFVAILWFLVSAGESIHAALKISSSRCNGFVANEFAIIIQKVEHGSILQHELENLAAESRCEEVRELATKLAVALLNGTAIADQLGEFAGTVNAKLRTELLDRAGKNETKMMIPLVFVILPVTVMFALYPSISIIQMSFI
jgi:tight adherence protein C